MILFDAEEILILVIVVVIIICLHVWYDVGTQFPKSWSQMWSSAHVSWNRSPSTTDNCLKFMLQHKEAALLGFVFV